MLLRYPALILILCTLAAPSAAHADETSPFVMTDPSNYDLALGFESSIGQFNDNTLVGLEGWLNWPLGDRWSVAARLPLALSFSDGNNGASIGNLTFDGTFFVNARKRRRAVRTTGINISVSTPTAADSGSGLLAANNFANFYLPEPGLYRPNTTTLRVHGLLRTEGYRYFAQLEFGMHQLINRGNDDWSLLRGGVALGFKLSRSVVFIGELTTMSDILDDVIPNQAFWHTLDIGMRVDTGRGGVLGLRGYLPLDQFMRNQDALGLILSYEVYL